MHLWNSFWKDNITAFLLLLNFLSLFVLSIFTFGLILSLFVFLPIPSLSLSLSLFVKFDIWQSCVCVVSCQLRVSKEQEHFLVLPNGLAYGEVTASSLVSSLLMSKIFYN